MNTGPEGETMTGQLQGDFTFRQQRWSQLKRVLSLGKHDHPDVQPKECEETDAAPSMQPSTDCTLGACPKQSSREQSLEEDNINQKCQNWEESIQRMEYEINNPKTKLRKPHWQDVHTQANTWSQTKRGPPQRMATAQRQRGRALKSSQATHTWRTRAALGERWRKTWEKIQPNRQPRCEENRGSRWPDPALSTGGKRTKCTTAKSGDRKSSG